MQNFFSKPTPQKVAEYIYSTIIFVHETGGKQYRYSIPQDFSNSFVDSVIEILGERLLDVDIIEKINGYILIDWS
jgi:hypothetical protein